MHEKLTSYVRITNRRKDGFVEFNFALEDPALYIEMILPSLAFEEFCTLNAVQMLTAEQAAYVDQQELKWRYGTSDHAEINELKS